MKKVKLARLIDNFGVFSLFTVKLMNSSTTLLGPSLKGGNKQPKNEKEQHQKEGKTVVNCHYWK